MTKIKKSPTMKKRNYRGNFFISEKFSVTLSKERAKPWLNLIKIIWFCSLDIEII